MVVPEGNVMLDVYASVPDTVVTPTPPRRLAARALEFAGLFCAQADARQRNPNTHFIMFPRAAPPYPSFLTLFLKLELRYTHASVKIRPLSDLIYVTPVILGGLVHEADLGVEWAPHGHAWHMGTS